MAEKKKLLVTASTFPRWKGDTEPRFVLDLSAHMLDEYDVTVLAPAAPGAKDREILDGVKVIRYHYFPIHKWETLCYPGAIVPRVQEKKIRVLLIPFLFLALYMNLIRRSSEYDIIHAHWIIPQGIVQSFLNKPYIVTGHGGDVYTFNQKLIKRLKIRCLKKAKYVTVVSGYAKRILQQMVPEIEPDIIPMGVNIEQFSRKYHVENYFGQKDKKVILFVGRLVEIKGLAYLIDAMRQIDAMLVIVGDGPLRKELEAQTTDLEGKVAFLGAKTHEELKTIYASADIFAVPSITIGHGVQEGCPTVLMEAMASGLAIVASDSGGIASVIHHMQNGLLCKEKDSVELAQSINKLIADKEFYNKLVSNAGKMIRQYDYKVLAEKFMEIYNRSQ